MAFTKDQEKFLNLVKQGKNVFLTGKAGTGKSYVVKSAIDLLKQQGKNCIALAPTGVAANNIGGATLHSTFSLRPFGVLDYSACNFLKGEKRRMLQNVHTIIIDEVSMLRPDILDAINWTLIKNGCKTIMGYQIILVGDMKQLEAPIDDNMRSVLLSKYDNVNFDAAQCFNELNIENVELHEVLRQSDTDFIHHLNIIREGGKSEYFRQFVSKDKRGIILAPHNSTVHKYNAEGLAQIQSKEYLFKAIVTGEVKAGDFNLENEIRVKDGCKIMYLANSKNNELINGTLGIFKAIGENYFITVNGVDYALNPVNFTKHEYVLNDKLHTLELKEIGSIEQYPIKLAYALSIHKSQGLTFEEVTIDLTLPCFSKGQMYVAISRVKSPEGLTIITK